MDILMAGKRFATVQVFNNNTENVIYYSNDPLGSSTLAYDEKGTLVEQTDTLPYGDKRFAIDSKNVTSKFALHDRNENTNQAYMKARNYDFANKHFQTQDVISKYNPQAYIASPQELNMYSYAKGNPVMYNDPTGEQAAAIARPILLRIGVPSLIESVFGAKVADVLLGDPINEYLNNLLLSKNNDKNNPIPIEEILNTAPYPKAGSSNGDDNGKKFKEKDKEKIDKESEGKCVFCKEKTKKEGGPLKRETDHSISRKNGGDNTPENANNTCRTCNRTKGSDSTSNFLKKIKDGTKNIFKKGK